MDEELYDEFGNYIGPEIEDEEEDEEENEEWMNDARPLADQEDEGMQVDAAPAEEAVEERRVILHEDKKYYPSADEIYPDAETLVQEEDTQPLETPIVAPVKLKSFSVKDPLPACTFSREFLESLKNYPALSRNILVAGHLHHGKTLLIDMLVQQTHEKKWNTSKPVKYTDSLKLEQDRQMSLKTSAMSLVLQNSSGKSYLFNILDTPGHVNFSDEVTASLQLADGVVLVVDALEGVMVQTERIIKHACREGVPITVIINKVDRLILELKLPPDEAYFKLKHTLDEINLILQQSHHQPDTPPPRVSPELGNVCFASGMSSWIFSVFSFARLYCETYGNAVDPQNFGKRLWGDFFIDPATGSVVRKASKHASKRTFVHFILEPLYKVYGQVIGEDQKTLQATLGSLGIHLTAEQFKMDPNPLLKLVLTSLFGTASALVDMCVKHIPSPLDNASTKVDSIYTGPLNSELAQAMRACDREGPLMVNVTKLICKDDGSGFDCLARVFSGTLKVGQRVRVLGEGYTPEDEEDSAVVEVTGLAISQARYQVAVDSVSAGALVLIDGVDAPIMKTATICSAKPQHQPFIFKPLRFNTSSVVKVAVEPVNPSELPKMLDALRKINKSYPLATTKVEESGEHVVLGTGELYMDCILHDLRRVYGELEVKVADPVCCFCETVVDTSSLKCFAETLNKKNKITMIAEPMDKGLSVDIEGGAVDITWSKREVSEFFQTKYHWDALESRSVWAFGPDANGPNLVMDYTLPTEVNKSVLNSSKDYIVQGFQWATREGPLCEEPIRNVKFKLCHAELAAEPIYRGGNQLIPTSRRCAYSSFLMATPRLMEPVFAVEIQAPEECMSAIYNVLARRRGHVTQDLPKAGTPLYTVKAFIPVMDSFGFETDLRAHTQGQAFCLSLFDHWAIVPGDPLDKNILLRPLEPQPPPFLAREFMVKTRRRKGLSEEVSINQFFDEAMLLYLSQQAQMENFM